MERSMYTNCTFDIRETICRTSGIEGRFEDHLIESAINIFPARVAKTMKDTKKGLNISFKKELEPLIFEEMRSHAVAQNSTTLDKEQCYQKIYMSVWKSVCRRASTQNQLPLFEKPANKNVVMTQIRGCVRNMLNYKPTWRKRGHTQISGEEEISDRSTSSTSKRLHTRPRSSAHPNITLAATTKRKKTTVERGSPHRYDNLTSRFNSLCEVYIRDAGGGYKAFTAASPEKTSVLKRKLKDECNHELNGVNTGHPMYCDLDSTRAAALQFQSFGVDLTTEENEVFVEVLRKQAAGQFPDCDVVQVPEFGFVLVNNETDPGKETDAGVIYAHYNGYIDFSENCPDYDPEVDSDAEENGFDMVLTIFRGYKGNGRDTCVSPFRNGGIAHFAASAAPSPVDDFKNVNAILVAKRLQVPKDLSKDPKAEICSEVHLFLVLLRPLRKNEPVVWHYGFAYFEDLDTKMGENKRTWRKVELLYKAMNLSYGPVKDPLKTTTHHT